MKKEKDIVPQSLIQNHLHTTWVMIEMRTIIEIGIMREIIREIILMLETKTMSKEVSIEIVINIKRMIETIGEKAMTRGV
jgi:hypothetical protein